MGNCLAVSRNDIPAPVAAPSGKELVIQKEAHCIDGSGDNPSRDNCQSTVHTGESSGEYHPSADLTPTKQVRQTDENDVKYDDMMLAKMKEAVLSSRPQTAAATADSLTTGSNASVEKLEQMKHAHKASNANPGAYTMPSANPDGCRGGSVVTSCHGNVCDHEDEIKNKIRSSMDSIESVGLVLGSYDEARTTENEHSESTDDGLKLKDAKDEMEVPEDNDEGAAAQIVTDATAEAVLAATTVNSTTIEASPVIAAVLVNDPPSEFESCNILQTACDDAMGWDACKGRCVEGATFSSQCDTFKDMKTIKEYAEWCQWFAKICPDGTWDINAVTWDGAINTAMFCCTYHATHSQEDEAGIAPPPTGKSTNSDYVYMIRTNNDGKIVSMTKIWNDQWALKELGWI